MNVTLLLIKFNKNPIQNLHAFFIRQNPCGVWPGWSKSVFCLAISPTMGSAY